MIFVVTGVHEHGFDRLVRAVDELARMNIINNVFIQIGYAQYKPQYCEWAKAIDYFEFEERMNQADLIITHGGAGCIAGALERLKKTIIVPRLKKYNEHNNDHQLELTSVLEQTGRVLACYNIKDLASVINIAQDFKPKPAAGKNNIVNVIENYLQNQANVLGKNIR